MDFPHLRRDTDFPYISNVDVYQFQNVFDYNRWNENTRVRLVNVIWNDSYTDVVKFDTNTSRDEYFDSLDDAYEITLEQAARIVPDGYVKLPIPYDVAARYNYLYITMPIATSKNDPIDWETLDGIRKWYYFVDDLVYRAPNSTELKLIPDVWTNFQNDIEINYMMLERGHAPVAYSDVDDYLENPISNSEYLLAPDVDFGGNTIVSNSELISFGKGVKWVILCSTCSPSDISNIGSVNTGSSSAFTPPVYYDTSDRYGKQLRVDGFNFGDDGDYSNVITPTSTNVGDILPNNITAYAIRADECFRANNSALSDLMEKNPNFINSIVAMFVVPVELITLSSNTYSIAGHNFYTCKGVNTSLGNITLDKEDFGFPTELQRFAKLYTFPYSSIEITDNEGKKINIKVEDTGNVTANLLTSIAFPFLDIRVFFSGIGGEGSSSYVWNKIDGTTKNVSITSDDWFDYSFDWGIPTYSLYMDGKTAYNLGNYNSLQNARRDALTAYHVSVRDANTACENSKDLAYTAEYNVNDSAATLVTNMGNTTDTQRANADLTIATNTANTASANDCGTAVVTQNNYQIDADNTSTNIMSIATTITQNETSVACAGNTGGATVFNGTVNGAMGSMGIASSVATAALAGGAAAGPVGLGVAGLIGTAALIGNMTSNATASANMSNAMAMAQCNSQVVGATQQRNTEVAAHATSANTTIQVSLNNDRSTQNTNNNDCIDAQTDNTINCETTNTANDADTMNGNAARTRGTSVANAGYTQEVAILDAKEILENAQKKAQAVYNDARNLQPIRYGSYSGDMASDAFMTRGLQIKIRTESKSAIRQAGDTFARYGYALNQVWNVSESGLTLMEHFTYWKASDIWVDDTGSSTNYVNKLIENIFLKGVTVWSDPDMIGRVSIYDN